MPPLEVDSGQALDVDALEEARRLRVAKVCPPFPTLSHASCFAAAVALKLATGVETTRLSLTIRCYCCCCGRHVERAAWWRCAGQAGCCAGRQGQPGRPPTEEAQKAQRCYMLTACVRVCVSVLSVSSHSSYLFFFVFCLFVLRIPVFDDGFVAWLGLHCRQDAQERCAWGRARPQPLAAKVAAPGQEEQAEEGQGKACQGWHARCRRV